MVSELIAAVARLLEATILIATVGMLGWFVNNYKNANTSPPASILVLFIVSVLALFWCLLVPCVSMRSSSTASQRRPNTPRARAIACIDVLFTGGFIAGVYYLRGIRHADCTTLSRSGSFEGSAFGFTVSGTGLSLATDKSCVMLKASWAFGIICCILFPVSALMALHRGDGRSHPSRVYV